jgi:uncharacterized membrane protein
MPITLVVLSIFFVGAVMLGSGVGMLVGWGGVLAVVGAVFICLSVLIAIADGS